MERNLMSEAPKTTLKPQPARGEGGSRLMDDIGESILDVGGLGVVQRRKTSAREPTLRTTKKMSRPKFTYS